MEPPLNGALHHVELWVPDLERGVASLGWLLEAMGYEALQRWETGRSWKLGVTYLVIEQSPAMTGEQCDRQAPGLNHLAFHVENDIEVERLVAEGAEHGWALMFGDRHPFAGGAAHYAAYLENQDGFEVELVAGTITTASADPALGPPLEVPLPLPAAETRQREHGDDGGGRSPPLPVRRQFGLRRLVADDLRQQDHRFAHADHASAVARRWWVNAATARRTVSAVGTILRSRA